MADCCAQKGIVHQKINPYFSQENGVAERLNRTLVKRARAMLKSSGLGKEFWAEAVNTANYVRNRTVSSIHGKTPIEVLTGKKPSISHLRVFGSECYVHVPFVKRKKLDAVSQKGVFLGYEPNTKGYRMLTKEGNVEISKDVTFQENDLDELGGARGLSRVSLLDLPGAGPTPAGETSTRDDPEPAGEDENGEVLMLLEPQTPQTKREVTQGTSDAPRAESEKTDPRGESEDGDDPGEVQKERRRYNLRGAEAQKAGTLYPENEWHRANSAKEEKIEEPQSYEEALAGEDAELWQKAMRK
jgi:hypothetical protein